MAGKMARCKLEINQCVATGGEVKGEDVAVERKESS